MNKTKNTLQFPVVLFVIFYLYRSFSSEISLCIIFSKEAAAVRGLWLSPRIAVRSMYYVGARVSSDVKENH